MASAESNVMEQKKADAGRTYSIMVTKVLFYYVTINKLPTV